MQFYKPITTLYFGSMATTVELQLICDVTSQQQFVQICSFLVAIQDL